MKNARVLLLLMVLQVAVRCAAQTAPPPVMAGKVKYEQVNGRWKPMVTTCEEVLSVPRLVCNDGWKVESFVFAMRPEGKDYVGPFRVKGTEFTQQIKDALREHIGGQGEIDIESIMVTSPGGFAPRTMNPIRLKYKG